MPQEEKLVARGQLQNAWAALALTPAISAVILGLIGLGVGMTERPLTLRYSLGLTGAGCAIGLLAGLLASLFIAALLLASTARVQYYIRGTTIVVKRGRRNIRSIDALSCASIRGTGKVTTRELVVDVGVFWTMFDDYPCIEYTQLADDGRAKTTKLPRVLILGSADPQACWALAREELIVAGMKASIWDEVPTR